MTAELESKHRRQGLFAVRSQKDPGTGFIASGVPHKHEEWQIREGATTFYCSACGENVREKVCAVGWAGEQLEPCMMQVSSTDFSDDSTTIEFDAAPILAALSLEERRQVLADDPVKLYETAVSQFLAKRSFPTVTVLNADDVTTWVEYNRGACLAGDGWRETRGEGWTAVVAENQLTWHETATRANLHVARAVDVGKFAVLIHDGEDFEIVPCDDLAAATDYVKAAGFYSAGFPCSDGAPIAYEMYLHGNGTDRSANMYFPKEGAL